MGNINYIAIATYNKKDDTKMYIIYDIAKNNVFNISESAILLAIDQVLNLRDIGFINYESPVLKIVPLSKINASEIEINTEKKQLYNEEYNIIKIRNAYADTSRKTEVYSQITFYRLITDINTDNAVKYNNGIAVREYVDVETSELIIEVYKVYGVEIADRITKTNTHNSKITKKMLSTSNNSDIINTYIENKNNKAKMLDIGKLHLCYYDNVALGIMTTGKVKAKIPYELNTIGYGMTFDILSSRTDIELTKEQIESMKYNLELSKLINTMTFSTVMLLKSLNRSIESGRIKIYSHV